MEIRNEGLIKDATEMILKEIQTVVTICYVLAIGIGMLFNYRKYSEFGIDIFNYADLLDFLITPFSNFIVLLFTILSSLVAYIAFKFDAVIKVKFPNFYSRQYFGLDKYHLHSLVRNFLHILIFLAYLFLSSLKYGEISRKEIMQKPSISIRYSDNEIAKGKMIGKTREVIFLFSDEKVKVIPITALVKEIEIKK